MNLIKYSTAHVFWRWIPNDRLSFTPEHNETTIIPYNLSVKKNEYNRMSFCFFKEIMYGPELTETDCLNASYQEPSSKGNCLVGEETFWKGNIVKTAVTS